MERASQAELAELLRREYPDLDLGTSDSGSRTIEWTDFRSTKPCCCRWRTSSKAANTIPRGMCLYHSLQVFEHARERLPYDEEFLLAALLHDVGKGIDPSDHVAAGLEALEGFITERTAWMIEHHMEAQAIRDGTLGVRAHRRLRENDSYEELRLLAECDRLGRQVGVRVLKSTRCWSICANCRGCVGSMTDPSDRSSDAGSWPG